MIHRVSVVIAVVIANRLIVKRLALKLKNSPISLSFIFKFKKFPFSIEVIHSHWFLWNGIASMIGVAVLYLSIYTMLYVVPLYVVSLDI